MFTGADADRPAERSRGRRLPSGVTSSRAPSGDAFMTVEPASFETPGHRRRSVPPAVRCRILSHPGRAVCTAAPSQLNEAATARAPRVEWRLPTGLSGREGLHDHLARCVPPFG